MRTSQSNNPVIRRIENLPHTFRNISQLCKDGLIYTLLFPCIYIFRLVLYKLAKTELGQKYLYPYLPKLGDFFQHAPKKIDFLDINQESRATHPLPKISIVTPSFKQGEFIERTLKSVLDQNYDNLEYFVQDGGSDDSTTQILEQYDDQLTFWESKPDNGQTHALNLGFARSSGEIMAYLNSDDLLLPNTLYYIANFFNENPDIDVVYGNRLIVNEHDELTGQWILHGHDDEILPYIDYVPQETMFWRRTIWQKAGGQFDENFRFAMDWDLILRFRRVGAKFQHVPRLMGAFRVHESQKTMSVINDIGEKEMNILRTRELGKKPTPMQILAKNLPFLIKHAKADRLHRYSASS